jgi:hypothetical protein
MRDRIDQNAFEEYSGYAKKRDAAIIQYIETGSDEGVRKLVKDNGGDVPEDLDVFHAGILKAAHYCTNIPDDIKAKAFTMCLEMGFNPYIAE